MLQPSEFLPTLQTLQSWTSHLPSLPPSFANLPLIGTLPTKFPLNLNLPLTNLNFNLPTKSALINLPTQFPVISLPTEFTLPRLSLGKLSTLANLNTPQDQDQLLNRIWIGLLVLEALLVLGVVLRGVFWTRSRSRWGGRAWEGRGRELKGDERLLSPWESPMGSPVVSPVGSPVRGGGYYRGGYGQEDGYFGYDGYGYGQGYRDGYQRRRMSSGVGRDGADGGGGVGYGYGWEK